MRARYPTLAAFVVAMLALEARPAHAQDIEICFATADRVAGGEQVSAADKEAGHKACQAALAATSSIVQKSQIQDADFDIVGRPLQKPN
jgi:tryptophan synthase alpha subunit